MPITSTCPHCQKSVRFTEQNSGLQLRCPYCQLTFRADPLPPPEVSPGIPSLEIPADSRGWQSGAVPIASENAQLPFMDFRAMIPPEPVAGELPYPTPDEQQPLPLPAPPPAPLVDDVGWWHVSQGLLLILGAQVIFWIADLIVVAFPFLTREKSETVAMIGLLACIAIGVCIQTWGLLTCLRAPKQAGVRGLLHGSIWPSLGAAVLLLLAQTLLLLAYLGNKQDYGLRPRPLLEFGLVFGLLLFIFAAFVFAVGNLIFLVALRGMAHHFQKPRLARHLLIFTIGMPTVVVLFGLGAVVMAVIANNLMRHSDSSRIIGALIWNVARISVHAALLIWGWVLVNQLRKTMEHAMEAAALETA